MIAAVQQNQEVPPGPQGKDLVRFVALGSVDDGKSTLIGRLLYETGALYDDQIEHVRKATRNGEPIDYSLFTDGLRAEREQGITIDVAYRYFETARRKYILADAPGHAQYTRNMATGASTADVGIVLVDARLGLLPQSRRHATIAALLGIPRMAVAINKMDLVGFDPQVFARISDQMREFCARLGLHELAFFPVSARHGDNVAQRSPRTPWFRGGTVLDFLETVEVARDRTRAPLRLPVQTVLRPHLDYRAVAGQIASGALAVGDELVVLPSGARTRVRAIDTFEGEVERAFAPMSVAVRLADAVDVGRGDLLAHPADAPALRTRVDATAVWLSERPLDLSRSFLLKHTTRLTPARVEEVRHRLDPESLERGPAGSLSLNDIGGLRISCARPIACDAYGDNRITGAFILIDALTNETVAAGTLDAQQPEAEQPPAAPRAALAARAAGPVLVVRGESEGATLALAHQVERALAARGRIAAVVRSAESALACASAGVFAICAAAGEPAANAVRAALRLSGADLLELVEPGGPEEIERALARAEHGNSSKGSDTAGGGG
ncbi:MAG TPA: GTP-binding protein [Myxococcales bacterium]|nr:GTP-binding protein [Myxococcales bacterium]